MKRPGPGRATEGGLGPLRWSTSRSRRRLSSRCKSGETVQSLTGYPENSNPHTTGEDGAHKGWSAQRSSTGCCWRTATSPATGRGQRRKISTRGGRGSSRSRGRIGKRRSGGAQGSTFGRYVAGDQAREWLGLPANPNGRTNADVLKPWVNGMDLTRRPAGKWIVDFGWKMSAGAAAREYWWRHVEPRQGMWGALDGLVRYIATARVAKHRLFGWYDTRICPDSQLIVIARNDDTTFGILHSRFHELWSLRLCTWLGKGNDPRYTPSTTFETFPFPAGLTPEFARGQLRGGPARGFDHGGLAPTRRAARPLAQPARMGRVGGRAVCRISATSCSSRRGGREGAQGSAR